MTEIVRQDICCLSNTLFNRYFRYYYVSRDKNYRLILDCELTFFKAHDILLNTFAHHQNNQHTFVIELKYEVDQDQIANKVASYFPFRVTRNTKYVEGVERVYV